MRAKLDCYYSISNSLIIAIANCPLTKCEQCDIIFTNMMKFKTKLTQKNVIAAIMLCLILLVAVGLMVARKHSQVRLGSAERVSSMAVTDSQVTTPASVDPISTAKVVKDLDASNNRRATLSDAQIRESIEQVERKRTVDRENRELAPAEVIVAYADGQLAVVDVSSQTVDEALEQIGDKPVAYIQENYVYTLDEQSSTQTDHSAASLYQQYALDKMSVPQAWQDATGKGVIVAVLDTGVDLEHEDLRSQLWDGSNCVDGDGNYLGDCRSGYDIVDHDKIPLPENPESYYFSHGTHVAGIAAAARNDFGVTGVAPDAQIMAVRLGTDSFTTYDIIAGIRFAAANGAQVINASFGRTLAGCEDYDQLLYQTIANYGGIFVTSAGNNAQDLDAEHFYSQASFSVDTRCWQGLDNVISVGASNEFDQKSYFSNYNRISVFAPGEQIISTISGNDYEYKQGTSMAAPNVSGVVALMLEAKPDITPRELKETLMSTVDVNSLPAISRGRVNAAAAVAAVKPNKLSMDEINERIKVTDWVSEPWTKGVGALLHIEYHQLELEIGSAQGSNPILREYGYVVYRDGAIAKYDRENGTIEMIGHMSPDTVAQLTAIADPLVSTQVATNALNFQKASEGVTVNVYNRQGQTINLQNAAWRDYHPKYEKFYQEIRQMMIDLQGEEVIKEFATPTVDNTRLAVHPHAVSADFYQGYVKNNAWYTADESRHALMVIDYRHLSDGWEERRGQGSIPHDFQYGYTIYTDGWVSKWSWSGETIEMIGMIDYGEVLKIKHIADHAQTDGVSYTFTTATADGVSLDVYNQDGERIALQWWDTRYDIPELNEAYQVAIDMLTTFDQPQVVIDGLKPVPTSTSRPLSMDEISERIEYNNWSSGAGDGSYALLNIDYGKIGMLHSQLNGGTPILRRYGYVIYRNGQVAAWDRDAGTIKMITQIAPETLSRLIALIDPLEYTQSMDNVINFIDSDQSVDVDAYNAAHQPVGLQGVGRDYRPELEPIYSALSDLMTDLHDDLLLSYLLPTDVNTMLESHLRPPVSESNNFFSDYVMNNAWYTAYDGYDALLTLTYHHLVDDWQNYSGSIPDTESYGYTLYKDARVARWDVRNLKIEMIGKIPYEDMLTIKRLLKDEPMSQSYTNPIRLVETADSLQISGYNKDEEIVAIQVHAIRQDRPEYEVIYEILYRAMKNLNQPEIIVSLVAPTQMQNRQ